MTICKQKEFQNFLERSLCNRFGQLLDIPQQSIEYEIEHDIYGTCGFCFRH